MKPFTYISHHLPSGQQFEYEAEFVSEADFLRHLDDWNRQGGNEWKYRSGGGVRRPEVPMENQSRGKRIADHPSDVDRLIEAGVWPKSVDQPDLNEILGEIPNTGC